MPFSDPRDARDYQRKWRAADRKKKRDRANMSLADILRRGRELREERERREASEKHPNGEQ